MIYNDGVPMDNRGRVTYCPQCNNQEIDDDAEFCHICGLSLYNTCENNWDEEDEPKHRNASNARYCKICGRPTIYNIRQILKPYETVMKEGVIVKPVLHEPDTTYDRYIDMSVATDNQLLTAADMVEFDELMNGTETPF